MRPLVAVRRAAPFDPDALSRSPLCWPLLRALHALGPLTEFPEASSLNRVFDGEAPVRFVPAAPRARRHRGGRIAPVIDPRMLYDGRITLAREVPTRDRCWHDFMNALVWGTFPRAKSALHARQHRAVSARVEPGATALPPARTRELDALAILDEGGVVVLAEDPESLREELKRAHPGALRDAMSRRAATAVVFGHAVYESLALGVRPAVVGALVLPKGDLANTEDASGRDVVRHMDRTLSDALENAGHLRTPDDLARVDISDVRPA
ncbi:MAG TPA: DUF3025 domain-containing protein [Polyangiaceae bacterium]|jgi:hypothetical protein|nr:DUF3025 domain-containing protein [Polyangiaceae bacterium]